MDDSNRQAGDLTETEITPEMVDAGLTALEAACGALSQEEAVRSVYSAMADRRASRSLHPPLG